MNTTVKPHTDIQNFIGKLCFVFLLLTIFSIEVSVSAGGIFFPLFVLLGTIFFYLKRDDSALYFSKSSLFLILTILCLAASVFINWGEMSEPIRAFKKMRYLVLGLFCIQIFRALCLHYLNSKTIKLIINTLCASVIIATLYSFGINIWEYDFIRGIEKVYTGRMHGMTGIMSYGYEMPIIMLFLWGIYLNRKVIQINLNFKFVLFACIVGTLGIFSSGTRGGVLSFVISFPFLFFFINKKIFKKIALVSFLLIFSALVTIKFGLINTRLTMKSNNISNRIRISKIYASFEAFKDKPLWGHGLLSEKSDYKILSPRGVIEDSLYDTHNTYLQVLTDAGLVGFIFFALFMFYWAKELFQRNDIMTHLFFSSFLCFSIENLFHTQFVSGVNTALNLVLFYAVSQLPLLDIFQVKKTL